MAIVVTGPTSAIVSVPQVTAATVHITSATITITGAMVAQYGSRFITTGVLPTPTLNAIAAVIQAAVEADQGWAPGSSTVQLIAGP